MTERGTQASASRVFISSQDEASGQVECTASSIQHALSVHTSANTQQVDLSIIDHDEIVEVSHSCHCSLSLSLSLSLSQVQISLYVIFSYPQVCTCKHLA